MSDIQNIYMAMLLDRSGSMDSIKDSVIEGTNDFIKDQKDNDGTMSMSLYQFDTEFDAIFENKYIEDVEYITSKLYVPRGMTSLVDSICRTITTTQDILDNSSEHYDRVIIVVQTDGQENSSKEYNRQALIDMVKAKEDNNKWEFVFLGANQDAIASATSFGMNANNAASYVNSTGGYKNMARNLSFKTLSARNCNTEMSWDDDERNDLSKVADELDELNHKT